MELMAAMGLAGAEVGRLVTANSMSQQAFSFSEVFRYNRENFEFDQVAAPKSQEQFSTSENAVKLCCWREQGCWEPGTAFQPR